MSDSDEPPERTAARASPPSPPARLSEQIQPAILNLVTLTLLAGCAFPLTLAAVGWLLFPHQARGSLVIRGGVVVGSELIGQEFSRPAYFQCRPSAAGNGYDG